MLKLLAFAILAAPIFSEASSLGTHGKLAATFSPLKAKGPSLKKLLKIDESIQEYASTKTGDVRGSKKLEDSAREMATGKLSAIQNSLRKIPIFKNKNSQSSTEKQASSVSPATRRLLQDSDEVDTFKFADSSSSCQAAITDMGFQPADLDKDDPLDVLTPDKYKACEGFLGLVLDRFSDSSNSDPISDPIMRADFKNQSDFCTQACKADSISWLTKFGSSCGMDAADFFLDRMTKTSDELEKMGYLMAAGLISDAFLKIEYGGLGAEFGCMPSNTNICWERDYWWEVVYNSDSDDSDSDDSDSDGSCLPDDMIANKYVATECPEDLVAVLCTASIQPGALIAASDCCYATAFSFSLASTAIECSWMPFNLKFRNAVYDEPVPQCTMDFIDYLCDSSSNLGTWVDDNVDKFVSCCEDSNPIEPPCTKDGKTMGDVMKAYDEERKSMLSAGEIVMPSVLLLLSLCFAGLVM